MEEKGGGESGGDGGEAMLLESNQHGELSCGDRQARDGEGTL